MLVTGIMYPVYWTLDCRQNTGCLRKKVGALQVGKKERDGTESYIEGRIQKSKCAEKSLHRQEAKVDEQMESPKCTSWPMQPRKEVDHNVEHQNPGGRERYVGKSVG